MATDLVFCKLVSDPKPTLLKNRIRTKYPDPKPTTTTQQSAINIGGLDRISWFRMFKMDPGVHTGSGFGCSYWIRMFILDPDPSLSKS